MPDTRTVTAHADGGISVRGLTSGPVDGWSWDGQTLRHPTGIGLRLRPEAAERISAAVAAATPIRWHLRPRDPADPLHRRIHHRRGRRDHPSRAGRPMTAQCPTVKRCSPNGQRLPAAPLLEAVAAYARRRQLSTVDVLGPTSYRALNRVARAGTVTLIALEHFCERISLHPRQVYGDAYDRAAFTYTTGYLRPREEAEVLDDYGADPQIEAESRFRVPARKRCCDGIACCPHVPVADMLRGVQRPTWYGYCVHHLRQLNREIRDGRVWWLGAGS
jgi:hypothetical protein